MSNERRRRERTATAVANAAIQEEEFFFFSQLEHTNAHEKLKILATFFFLVGASLAAII